MRLPRCGELVKCYSRICIIGCFCPTKVIEVMHFYKDKENTGHEWVRLFRFLKCLRLRLDMQL
jgi:hypothetical protein